MTTYADVEVACGCCGTTFTHQELASCYTAGPAALDTRPSEMMRSTMHSWIQHCPNCDYCAVDASKFDERCREVLLSDAYRNELNRGGVEKKRLRSVFKCAAMLYEACGDRASAAWENLHLAWIYDDLKQADLARDHRNKAADLILAILHDGAKFSTQEGASEAIVTDVLRRAGRGDQAIQIISEALGKDIPDVIKKVLMYERTLIQKKDIDEHGIEECSEPISE